MRVIDAYLKRIPKDKECLKEKARIYIEREAYVEALESLNEIGEIEEYEVLVLRGKVMIGLGAIGKGKELLIKALEMRSEDDELRTYIKDVERNEF